MINVYSLIMDAYPEETDVKHAQMIIHDIVMRYPQVNRYLSHAYSTRDSGEREIILMTSTDTALFILNNLPGISEEVLDRLIIRLTTSLGINPVFVIGFTDLYKTSYKYMY